MTKYSRSLRRWISLLIVILLAISAVACNSSKNATTKPVLVLADCSWDSIKVHNRIAGYIIEKGYGYPTPSFMFGETLPMLQGLAKGNVDIYMEVWADNIKEAWEKELAAGTVVNLGSNFPDAPQGWYVPTYLIKGDESRGIKALAPDLESVKDLSRYWQLFKDPEARNKGRFHNSAPGWVCTGINEHKFKAYGLDKNFTLFSTGSDTALSASMVTAYEKGEPWLGYYWEPTWVMGKLDMTLLEEPDYDASLWAKEDYVCSYPPGQVLISVNSQLTAKAPEIVEFLQKYDTTLEQNNDFLAYMNQTNGSEESAAIYFLKKYPDVWKAWVPGDVAARVEESLKEVI